MKRFPFQIARENEDGTESFENHVAYVVESAGDLQDLFDAAEAGTLDDDDLAYL